MYLQEEVVRRRPQRQPCPRRARGKPSRRPVIVFEWRAVSAPGHCARVACRLGARSLCSSGAPSRRPVIVLEWRAVSAPGHCARVACRLGARRIGPACLLYIALYLYISFISLYLFAGARRIGPACLECSDKIPRRRRFLRRQLGYRAGDSGPRPKGHSLPLTARPCPIS